MTTIAQDLGGVVRLLVPEPKPLPDLLLATYHEARGWNACREAMLKLIGTHSAEIAGALRDAERWQPIESAPRDGSYILICNSHGSWIAKYQHFYPSGYRPSSPWASMMLNHDHIDRPGRFDHPTHWRPLPAPPTQDSAMQQGGGGG